MSSILPELSDPRQEWVTEESILLATPDSSVSSTWVTRVNYFIFFYRQQSNLYINTLSRSDRYHADFPYNENGIFQMPNKQSISIY